MKKYLLLILFLSVLTSNNSKACWWSGNINYYYFQVWQCGSESDTDDEYSSEFDEFWKDYSGSEYASVDYITPEAIENAEQTGESDNEILQAALIKHDTEMFQYLKDLTTYYKLNGDLYNEWDYPTTEQIEEIRSTREELLNRAKNYSGDRLKDRYALLYMRCLFQLEKYNEVEQYWMSTGTKATDEPCRNAMMGLFAGALYHNKKTDAAINIFAQLGDIQSIKFCLNEKRNLKGIKSVYSMDKNSDVLVFLVQDFVNMYQETLDNDNNPWDFHSVSNNEARDFITFANQVADNNATRVPLMWKSAAALMSYYMGDYQNAKAYIDKCDKLAGTQRMKDVARVIKFVINTKTVPYTAAQSSYYMSEIKWMAELDDTFKNMLERIIRQNIVEGNEKTNKNFAILMSNNAFYSHGDLEQLSLPELEGYLSYISDTKKLSEFERYMLSEGNIGVNELNDRIGCKYLGEMNFDKAEAYLSKVPLSYYEQKSLAAYFIARDYHIARWDQTQESIDDWSEEGFDLSTAGNQRLAYCKELKTLMSKYNTTSGDARCQLAYELATVIHQASRWGNCWYILEDSWGVYDDPTESQTKYENKAVDFLNVAKKSSDNEVRQEALYALVWIKWHNYQYYYDDYGADDSNNAITSDMKSCMNELIGYWDGVFGKGDWTLRCDLVMDYARKH